METKHDSLLEDHYDLPEWGIDRFKGPIPELEFVVPGLIPLGSTGILYGAGGTGKSLIGLELGIRISVAHKHPSKWLDSFPIENGGNVAYFGAEDDEDELKRRTMGIVDVICSDVGISPEEVQSISSENMRLVNLFGSGKTLFKPKSLEPTEEFYKIERTLISLNSKGPVKLVVLDTRSLLSGVEGRGNAAVSKEVAYYQKLAKDFNATIVVIHHTSKQSARGGKSPTYRGENSLFANSRWAVQLDEYQGHKLDKGTLENPLAYVCLTNTKHNYSSGLPPVVIRKDKYRFTTLDRRSQNIPNLTCPGQGQNYSDQVLDVIRKHPGISQQDVILKAEIPHNKCRITLDNLVKEEFISFQIGERGSHHYSLKEGV